METKKDLPEKNEVNLVEEWEKPTVKELDINAITQSSIISGTFDGATYS
jgi:hypothetical protein